GRHFVRESHRPPAFAWRRAWAERTGSDIDVGLTLGMLALDSKPGRLQQRYATDWTSKAPRDVRSPADDRALTSVIAGFPYGEPRFVGALAAAGAETEPLPNGLAIGVNTSQTTSVPATPRNSE